MVEKISPLISTNISPHLLDNLVCSICDGDVFVTSQKFKVLPATHPGNPTGKEAPIAMTALMCIECQNTYENPSLLKTEKKITIATDVKKDKI